MYMCMCALAREFKFATANFYVRGDSRDREGNLWFTGTSRGESPSVSMERVKITKWQRICIRFDVRKKNIN